MYTACPGRLSRGYGSFEKVYPVLQVTVQVSGKDLPSHSFGTVPTVAIACCVSGVPSSSTIAFPEESRQPFTFTVSAFTGQVIAASQRAREEVSGARISQLRKG